MSHQALLTSSTNTEYLNHRLALGLELLLSSQTGLLEEVLFSSMIHDLAKHSVFALDPVMIDTRLQNRAHRLQTVAHAVLAVVYSR